MCLFIPFVCIVYCLPLFDIGNHEPAQFLLFALFECALYSVVYFVNEKLYQIVEIHYKLNLVFFVSFEYSKFIIQFCVNADRVRYLFSFFSIFLAILKRFYLVCKK